MAPAPHRLSRRRFLELSALAGGAVAVSAGPPARADAAPEQYLLAVYFSGGWDQLLAFDPRSAIDPRFQRVAARKAGGSGIETGYPEGAAVDSGLAAVLSATGGSGVQTRGALDFGPAVHARLLEHAADLSIVRGLSMDTLTHEVGRRYLLTGKFPRGLAASGSSLGTVVAGQSAGLLDLPNLAISSEAFNESYPTAAAPVAVRSASDVLNVLRPLGVPLVPGTDAAVQAFEGAQEPCDHLGIDERGLATRFRESRRRARALVSSSRWTDFQFALPPPVGNAAIERLFASLEISTSAHLQGPKGKAALAAQALTRGLSQAVSVTLQADLDDHFDLASTHVAGLRDGFEALGLLIRYLKASPALTGTGSIWARTTLLVFSEFARTPLMNGRDGRDHHLASSCLLAGPGLRGNRVFGATTDKGMGVERWNLATGMRNPAGKLIRPADVHATVLRSMGLDHSHLSNQEPQLLAPLLRG